MARWPGLDLAKSLADQVIRSVEKGAEIVLDGGHQETAESAYFKPMILKNVKPGMPAYDEELFGPVAAVMIAENAEEAIKNGQRFKVWLGRFYLDAGLKKGQEMARRMESGAVFINALVASSPEMPFGGIKKSGYGRELSYIGIREFVNQKSIWLA